MLEHYECEEKEEINVGEAVTLVLEIENDIDIKEGIIKCINDGNLDNTVYENYLTLL